MPFTPRIVMITASSVKEARMLAQGILEQHLAACVNIVPSVESHYHWKGELEKAEEAMMIIKSSAEQFEALAGYVRQHHSYECPEIVAVSTHEISPGLSILVGRVDDAAGIGPGIGKLRPRGTAPVGQLYV